MFCKKCGEFIPEGCNACPKCGQEMVMERLNGITGTDKPAENEKTLYKTDSSIMNGMPQEKFNTKISGWCWCAIASILCGCFTFYKGIDRLINYDSGEYYPYESVNAYVGGDAYNFIINGTHATAFFVLTTMFILLAIGLIIIHYLSLQRKGTN